MTNPRKATENLLIAAPAPIVAPVHNQVNQPSAALSPLVPGSDRLSYSLREGLHKLLNAETVDTHVHLCGPAVILLPARNIKSDIILCSLSSARFEDNPPPPRPPTEAPHFSAASVNQTRMFAQPPLGSSVLHYAEP